MSGPRNRLDIRVGIEKLFEFSDMVELNLLSVCGVGISRFSVGIGTDFFHVRGSKLTCFLRGAQNIMFLCGDRFTWFWCG